jgi:hypothetical protein
VIIKLDKIFRDMNLKYQRDIYFLLITIILFVVGFAVPIDQKDDKFLTLKKKL